MALMRIEKARKYEYWSRGVAQSRVAPPKKLHPIHTDQQTLQREWEREGGGTYVEKRMPLMRAGK